MRVNGIIAEYNPFHNGHKYHLDTFRKQTDADYTVVVMSGDFTQRGAPALLPKHERAKMALAGGADLVLELPLYYACGSAEYFAGGAVALLDKLGVIDYLGFGSEDGDIDRILEAAELLQAEPPAYREELKKGIRQGMTYPKARRQALCACFPDADDFETLLSTPNNILGIEYCRALLSRASTIKPLTIKRTGASYHTRKVQADKSYSSALSLRTALEDRDDVTLCMDQMPASAYAVLQKNWHQRCPVFDSDLSLLLHYKLTAEAPKGFTRYVDVSEELSDRIQNRLPEYLNYAQFVSLLKTKETTYTRVSRCLLHILLDMKQEVLADYLRMDYVPYARILGFRKDASPLLHRIKEASRIPLLSKLADAKALLAAPAYRMLCDDIRAAHLYQTLLTSRYGLPVENEYTKEIQMV